MEENAIEVGYSQRTAGANGIITSADCNGNPNVVAMGANLFATNCVLYQRDASTNYQTLVWLMTGTPASPAWTLLATLDANVITTKVHLKSVDILALNSTPIELIPAPGAGKFIEVLGVQGNLLFNSAAYATNTHLQIIDKVLGTEIAGDASALLAAVANLLGIICPVSSLTAVAISENSAVDVTVKTGDPITGDSDMDIYITYKINTL